MTRLVSVRQTVQEFLYSLPAKEKKWGRECRARYLQARLDRLNSGYLGLMGHLAGDGEFVSLWLKDLAVVIARLRQQIDWLERPRRGSITNEDIIHARQVDIVSLNLLESKPSGSGRHVALCPWHADRHASLVIYPGGKGFCCFVENRTGNAIDIVMKINGVGFIEAVKYLRTGSRS